MTSEEYCEYWDIVTREFPLLGAEDEHAEEFEIDRPLSEKQLDMDFFGRW